MNAAPPRTIAAALAWPGLERVDARLLLQRVLGWSHAQLVAGSRDTLAADAGARFLSLAARRLAGEPIAYLLGEREFYGRRFAVDPCVLIPRPETELLVDLALERIAPGRPARILDLGTGSGNIAISIALERPQSAVDALDVSEPALRVARRNAQALGAGNVCFIEGSWYQPVATGDYNLIVGNPPYIALGDPHLRQGDLRAEPLTALAAGAEGLDALAVIVAGAPRYLRPGGWLLLEHGYGQAARVAELLHRAEFEQLLLARDLAGQPRVSGGRTPSR